jgi:hypothetical protein
MEDVIFYCPVCHGRLLSTVAPVGGRPPRPLPGEMFYCPSCEMNVEPAPHPEVANTSPESANPADAPTNLDTTTAGGTHGDRLRGDAADEGASRWLKDPTETERNTWKDK